MIATTKKDLADWIREQKAAGKTPVFTIDNDMWFASGERPEGLHEMRDNDFVDRPSYPAHHLYGGGILTALAEIVGVTLDSV